MNILLQNIGKFFFIFLLSISFNHILLAQESKTGWAEVIDNEQTKNTYVAYYNDAPLGTVIQVHLKDSETPKIVFVRVIGKLPEKTKKKTMILISPFAAQKLSEQAEDKYKVEIKYEL